MAVTSDKPAPYTSPTAVLGIIERHRSRGLPSPIDTDVLARSGVVPDSLIPRTLQAMQALDLINDKGVITDTFESLRLAPEDQFKVALADWLKAAYADVLTFVDPAADDPTRIRDAFRNYIPTGQQGRMVTLFIGLCVAAGLIPEKEAQRQSSAAAPQRQRNSRPAAPSRRRRASSQQETNVAANGLPAPLAGLLATLPAADAGWTMARRDKFIAAFESVLDFCVPIVDADDVKELPEDSGQEN